MGQPRVERCRPALQVIEAGRDQMAAEIVHLAEKLRELEQALATAREELGRLALLGKR